MRLAVGLARPAAAVLQAALAEPEPAKRERSRCWFPVVCRSGCPSGPGPVAARYRHGYFLAFPQVRRADSHASPDGNRGLLAAAYPPPLPYLAHRQLPSWFRGAGPRLVVAGHLGQQPGPPPGGVDQAVGAGLVGAPREERGLAPVGVERPGGGVDRGEPWPVGQHAL